MDKYKEEYKPIVFPKDEQNHNHIIEWWYFNGNLKSKDGKIFSYMNCLFSADPKKVNIPFLNTIPLNKIYFSHYLLSNNEDKFESKIVPFCLMSKNSFTKPLLCAEYDNSCLIKEVSPFKYHIINDFVDLYLESEKKPLLLNKTGFLDFKVKTTYYYSLTKLKTTGIIKENNKWIPVKGVSWMDHQWAQTPLTDDDKWVWFSLQLNNDCQIVCMIYGDKIKTYHASMIDKNGKIKTTENIIISSQNKNNPDKDCYDLDCTIEIPEWDLKMETTPLKRDQEMTFETIKYWEGGIKIKGKMKDKKISGLGFSELLTKPRDGFIKYLFNKLKTNPIKNIKDTTDLSAKTIYIINQKIQNKF